MVYKYGMKECSIIYVGFISGECTTVNFSYKVPSKIKIKHLRAKEGSY